MTHGGNVWAGGDPAEWLDYSANIRPGGPPEWVRAALRKAMDNVPYYPQLSMYNARKALGSYLGLPPEMVLPTAGGIAAISLVTRRKVERVRIPAPAFVEYAQLSERSGLPVELCPLIAEDHRIRRPEEALGEDLGENTCVWLCNPSNPIGAGFAPQEVEELLSCVEKRHGILVVDEAFIHYCPENSVRHLLADHPRLLITGSMTKILGIPGVRLGYLAGGELLPELADCLDPWNLNCFAESVLLALPEHAADIEEEYASNVFRRESMRTGLEALGIYVYPSQANFFLCDFRRDVRPIEDILQEQKILVRRCMNFPGVDDGRHLRLAVKDERSNKRFLTKLEEAMQCAENH